MSFQEFVGLCPINLYNKINYIFMKRNVPPDNTSITK